MLWSKFAKRKENEKKSSAPVKKFATIQEFLVSIGIDPNVSKEELREIMKACDGTWQQVCEGSGLENISKENKGTEGQKRKFNQMDGMKESDGGPSEVVAKKSCLADNIPSSSGGNVTEMNELTRDFSAVSSINISHMPAYMESAFIGDTTYASTSAGASTSSHKSMDTTSNFPSLNLSRNSTFKHFGDGQSTISSCSERMDFQDNNTTYSVSQTSKLANSVVTRKTNQSDMSSKNCSLDIEQDKDFRDLYEDDDPGEFGSTPSDTDNLEEKSSLTITENTTTSTITESKYGWERSNLSTIQEELTTINQNHGDVTPKITVRRSSRLHNNSANQSSVAFSSQGTEVPSIRLMENQDFCELADVSENKPKPRWRGRTFNSTVESTTSAVTGTPSIGLRSRTKLYVSKTSTIKSIAEEESSRQTELPSMKLSQDPDFNELASPSDVSRKELPDFSIVDEYEVSDKRKRNVTSEDSFKSTDVVLPRGPIVPKYNFDNNTTPEVSQLSASSGRRRSLRSTTNTSIDTCPPVVKPIKAKRNLDISNYSNDDPKTAFKKAQQLRRKKIIVNNDTSDGDLFKNVSDSNEVSKKKDHSNSAISSQSMLSSQEVEEEGNNHAPVRRSNRIKAKRCILNTNDSVFQTETPAVKRVGKSKVAEKKNDTTIDVSVSYSPKSVASEGYSEFPLLIDETVANQTNILDRTPRHVIVRGKKREQKVLVVKRPKVIKPNQDQIQFLNLRRSQRNRIPPVDHSLLQKPIYETDENGLQTLVGVSEAVVQDPLFIKYGTADFEEIKHMRTS